MSAESRQMVREQRDAAARQSVAYIGNGERASKAKRIARLGSDLTTRETQVLIGAMSGLTYPQTAKWIGISEATVKQYSHNLLAKLGANTIAHAVAILCLADDARYAPTVAQARELRRLEVVA